MPDNFKKEFESILNENNELSCDTWLEKLHASKKPIVLFGAGIIGNDISRVMHAKGITPTCYCDNYRTGVDKVYKLPIISFEELKKDHMDSCIIISVNDRTVQEVENQLLAAGFSESNLISRIWAEGKLGIDYIRGHYEDYKWVYDNLGDDLSRYILLEKIRYNLYGYSNIKIDFSKDNEQYFEKSIIKLNDNEVFIDGGAYDGDTILRFTQNTQNKYSGIIAFEPDRENYDKLINSCKDFKNTKFYKNGLWSKDGTLTFAGNRDAASAVKEVGNDIINVVSLDNVLMKSNISPTFIKMDIEGAEYEALLGSKQTIQKYKPKLAICVYHKRDDVHSIPKLIKEINPEYRLYLRHYSDSHQETVCYAI